MSSIFRRKQPSPDQLSILQTIAQQAVGTVEAPGKSGPAKKSEALNLVGGIVQQLGLPVPPLLVDLAIEQAVRALPRRERS